MKIEYLPVLHININTTKESSPLLLVLHTEWFCIPRSALHTIVSAHYSFIAQIIEVIIIITEGIKVYGCVRVAVFVLVEKRIKCLRKMSKTIKIRRL